ncbi:hypothetical protein [Embleya sp. NPDC001921]
MQRWPHQPTLDITPTRITITASEFCPYDINILLDDDGRGWWLDIEPAGPVPRDTPLPWTVHVGQELAYEHGMSDLS